MVYVCFYPCDIGLHALFAETIVIRSRRCVAGRLSRISFDDLLLFLAFIEGLSDILDSQQKMLYQTHLRFACVAQSAVVHLVFDGD